MLYEHTPISRIEVGKGDQNALADLVGRIALDDDGQHCRTLDPTSVAPIVYRRVDRLPGHKNSADPAPLDARHQFDIVWQTFLDHYAFFELRDVDWNAQRTVWRAKLDAEATDAELFEVLSGLLSTLGDNHVELRAEGFEFAQPSGMLDVPLARLWQQEHQRSGGDVSLRAFMLGKFHQHVDATSKAIAAQFVGEAHRGADDKLVWGMLPDGIGYLNVRAMGGFAADDVDAEGQLAVLDKALDRAIADLADARAMIVDVRFNGGGWDTASLRVAGRFADQRRVAFSKKARTRDGFTPAHVVYVEPLGPQQFTRPTLLLTSPLTASAAEIFTYCMHVLPHVTHAGLPTMGIHSDMLVRHLPNGWSFSLSNEVYASADGHVFEKVGIPPEVEVSMFTADDLRDGKDQIVARAVEILKSRTTCR